MLQGHACAAQPPTKLQCGALSPQLSLNLHWLQGGDGPTLRPGLRQPYQPSLHRQVTAPGRDPPRPYFSPTPSGQGVQRRTRAADPSLSFLLSVSRLGLDLSAVRSKLRMSLHSQEPVARHQAQHLSSIHVTKKHKRSQRPRDCLSWAPDSQCGSSELQVYKANGS